MPAYNAARTMRATLEDLPAEGIAEVILVDDASRDGTAELAETLGLTVICHAHNLGYGGNQKTCYREALVRGADIVVMVHPDHQYNPRLVPASFAGIVMRRWARGCWEVSTSRVACPGGSTSQISF
jgi:glycosyltransferase involved in cell wall biosynthesis